MLPLATLAAAAATAAAPAPVVTYRCDEYWDSWTFVARADRRVALDAWYPGNKHLSRRFRLGGVQFARLETTLRAARLPTLARSYGQSSLRTDQESCSIRFGGRSVLFNPALHVPRRLRAAIRALDAIVRRHVPY